MMFRIWIYIILSVIVNGLVIGDPFWSMLMNKDAWIIIAVPLLLFGLGYKLCCEDDRIVKTLGTAMIVFLIVGFFAFWFVARIRNAMCLYLGLEDMAHIFRYYSDLSWLQIAAIGVCEMFLGGILLAGNSGSDKEDKSEADSPDNEQ